MTIQSKITLKELRNDPMKNPVLVSRGGSRSAATFKMECFVIIVNGWKPLTIITKRSILDVAAVLDPPLVSINPFMANVRVFRK